MSASDSLREHGLRVEEPEKLRHCREYFALPVGDAQTKVEL